MDASEDPFELEKLLREARHDVLIETAGLALIHTQDVARFVDLFARSDYEPSQAVRSASTVSGRKSVYRELSNDDLVDHAFWMARRFFPNDLASVRLYVMLSVKIYFSRVKAGVQPKALEHLYVDDEPVATIAAPAAEFSDDEDDDDEVKQAPPQPPPSDRKFSVPPSGDWVQIKQKPDKRQHKKERGVPSLTMRQLGFYDLVSLPLNWPAEVDPAYLYDNDAMALLVLSPTAHGALRYRDKQLLIGSSMYAAKMFMLAAWPVFVGNVGRVRRLYMPSDAVVVAAEKMRLMRFTAQGLNTKEVAAYWPTDAKSLDDFNKAERPDGSPLWLVAGPTLLHNQLLSKRDPKLPKGVSGAAELASDSSDHLYRRFPSWYMPTLDRIEVFVSYILTTSPELVRSLVKTRVSANSIEINRKYK